MRSVLFCFEETTKLPGANPPLPNASEEESEPTAWLASRDEKCFVLFRRNNKTPGLRTLLFRFIN
jgi:hypothetical protein